MGQAYKSETKKEDDMATTKNIEKQLKSIGCNYEFWGSTEISQLSSILMDDETIMSAINGYYEGGFGLLVVTDKRVLIIDKKPFVLNLEDLRYELITEVTYGARFVIATINFSIPTRTIAFSSWSMNKLHRAMRMVQQHVMDARNGHHDDNEDWFKRQRSSYEENTSKDRVASMSRLVRSVLIAAASDDRSPTLSYSSAQRTINPYATRFPSLARRRRYPAFYNQV